MTDRQWLEHHRASVTPMIFRYSETMRSNFPEVASRLLTVSNIHPAADVREAVARFHEVAGRRLALSSEGDFPEIQAWRRGFAKMGLKPTQYRCASEALLRRFRKDGSLPSPHPLIDLCNAASLAYALPIAVFDTEKIYATLEVRPASGQETYETFSGAIEKPEPGEIIFADAGGRAHARRWTNRQSGYSAVRSETGAALIVAEALHRTAEADLSRLAGELEAALRASWPMCRVSAVAPA